MKTEVYCFIGHCCSVGDLSFDRFGQRATFNADMAREVIRGGGAFIPRVEFDGIGFTQEELDMYAYGGGYPEPTEDFLERKQRAQDLFRDVRSRLELGPEAPVSGDGGQQQE